MTALPYTHPLVAYEGDDFSFTFRWSVGEDAESAEPVSFGPGWAGKSQVRPGKLSEGDEDEVLIEFDVFLGEEGQVTLSAPWEKMSGHTQLLKRTRARYDVQITDPEGKPRTVLRGPFLIEPETTR